MQNEGKSIRWEIQNQVGRVVLDKPPLNVLDIPMISEMHTAISHIAASTEAKVLVVDHLGKAFCAGVSIQDHTPDRVEQMIAAFHGLIRLLVSLAVPTVALVDGMALGGGCELAISCDMVLASERATFGQPEIKVGVFPPVAAVLFPDLIGRNRTLELLLTGESFKANEVHRIGLINRVFPMESFRSRSADFLTRMTSFSGPVLRATKRAVDSGLSTSWSGNLATVEQIYLRELMSIRDSREGLNAFLEKRKPVWEER